LVLVLGGFVGGCEGCEDGVYEDEALTAVCDEARDFVRSLAVIDEATIRRKASGLVAEIHEDVGDDGVIERCSLRFYDEQSRKVLSLSDYSSDSGPSFIHWVQAFDARFDEPIRYVTGSSAAELWAEPDWSEYDDEGRIVRSGGASGESRFFFDALGHRTRQERWEAGELVSFTNFQTDEEGRYLSWESDSDGDGELDRIQTWRYEGDMLVETLQQVLDLASGAWTVTRDRVEYDEQGRMLRWETDIGDDGVDAYSVTEWDGEVETMFLDHDADGVFDYREVVVWRAIAERRLRLSIHEDAGNDGDWERIRLYDYDELGRSLHNREVDPATGKTTHRQSTLYYP
jgi:hypothetical protein